MEWDGNPKLLSPLLLFCVAEEDKEQFWAQISLFGRICIVPLDTVSSFSSSFLKGISVIINCFSRLIKYA